MERVEKRSELKSAVDARGDAPSNTVDDIPSNTADDTSANVDAETTEKKEPKNSDELILNTFTNIIVHVTIWI